MSEKKKIPIIRYLSYLLVVSLLFTGVTFSRYSMTTSGDSSAPLSRFHCSYEVDEISATSIPNVDYWLKNDSAASTARAGAVFSGVVGSSQNSGMPCRRNS